MTVQQLVIYLIIYAIPGIALFSVACVIITQNYTSTTNRLIAILIFLYSFIFFVEFVRHLLPISYSKSMLQLLFGTLGLLIISVTFHFFIHITKFAERVRLPFYPVICYMPFFIIVIVLSYTDHKTETAVQSILHTPFFNLPTYVTLTVSTIIMFIFILILLSGLKHTTSHARRKILRLFTSGTIFGLVIILLFSYLDFSWILPTHLFLMIGILFPTLLVIAALKFKLLPSAVKKYRTMFNLIPASIIVVNSEWEILELNDYSRMEIFRYGQKDLNLLDFVQSNQNKEVLNNFIDLLQERGTLHNYPLSFKIDEAPGIVHYAVEASTVFVEDEKLFYLVWRNVTEEIENDRLIEHMAYHDALTNLHNRAYFVPKVKDQMSRLSAVSSKESALILIDLNRFKRINDTYGHAVGDLVLQHTAMLLKQAVRNNDLVARLGGDEFVVFLENFPTQQAVLDWSNRLQETFEQNPFETDSIRLQIKPSIGIAFFPADADNFEDLFQLADLNMYEHKLTSREKENLEE